MLNLIERYPFLFYIWKTYTFEIINIISWKIINAFKLSPRFFMPMFLFDGSIDQILQQHDATQRKDNGELNRNSDKQKEG